MQTARDTEVVTLTSGNGRYLSRTGSEIVLEVQLWQGRDDPQPGEHIGTYSYRADDYLDDSAGRHPRVEAHAHISARDYVVDWLRRSRESDTFDADVRGRGASPHCHSTLARAQEMAEKFVAAE